MTEPSKGEFLQSNEGVDYLLVYIAADSDIKPTFHHKMEMAMRFIEIASGSRFGPYPECIHWWFKTDKAIDYNSITRAEFMKEMNKKSVDPSTVKLPFLGLTKPKHGDQIAIAFDAVISYCLERRVLDPYLPQRRSCQHANVLNIFQAKLKTMQKLVQRHKLLVAHWIDRCHVLFLLYWVCGGGNPATIDCSREALYAYLDLFLKPAGLSDPTKYIEAYQLLSDEKEEALAKLVKSRCYCKKEKYIIPLCKPDTGADAAAIRSLQNLIREYREKKPCAHLKETLLLGDHLADQDLETGVDPDPPSGIVENLGQEATDTVIQELPAAEKFTAAASEGRKQSRNRARTNAKPTTDTSLSESPNKGKPKHKRQSRAGKGKLKDPPMPDSSHKESEDDPPKGFDCWEELLPSEEVGAMVDPEPLRAESDFGANERRGAERGIYAFVVFWLNKDALKEKHSSTLFNATVPQNGFRWLIDSTERYFQQYVQQVSIIIQSEAQLIVMGGAADVALHGHIGKQADYDYLVSSCAKMGIPYTVVPRTSPRFSTVVEGQTPLLVLNSKESLDTELRHASCGSVADLAKLVFDQLRTEIDKDPNKDPKRGTFHLDFGVTDHSHVPTSRIAEEHAGVLPILQMASIPEPHGTEIARRVASLLSAMSNVTCEYYDKLPGMPRAFQYRDAEAVFGSQRTERETCQLSPESNYRFYFSAFTVIGTLIPTNTVQGDNPSESENIFANVTHFHRDILNSLEDGYNVSTSLSFLMPPPEGGKGYGGRLAVVGYTRRSSTGLFIKNDEYGLETFENVRRYLSEAGNYNLVLVTQEGVQIGSDEFYPFKNYRLGGAKNDHKQLQAQVRMALVPARGDRSAYQSAYVSMIRTMVQDYHLGKRATLELISLCQMLNSPAKLWYLKEKFHNDLSKGQWETREVDIKNQQKNRQWEKNESRLRSLTATVWKWSRQVGFYSVEGGRYPRHQCCLGSRWPGIGKLEYNECVTKFDTKTFKLSPEAVREVAIAEQSHYENLDKLDKFFQRIDEGKNETSEKKSYKHIADLCKAYTDKDDKKNKINELTVENIQFLLHLALLVGYIENKWVMCYFHFNEKRPYGTTLSEKGCDTPAKQISLVRSCAARLDVLPYIIENCLCETDRGMKAYDAIFPDTTLYRYANKEATEEDRSGNRMSVHKNYEKFDPSSWIVEEKGPGNHHWVPAEKMWWKVNHNEGAYARGPVAEDDNRVAGGSNNEGGESGGRKGKKRSRSKM